MSHQFSPIAITGRGAVVPGALGVERFFANQLASRCFIRDVPAWLWPGSFFHSKDRDEPNRSYAAIAALAVDPPFDPAACKIPPATAQLLSRSHKMAIHAAREALAEAGVLHGKASRDRFGVFVSAISGNEISEALHRAVDEEIFMARMEELANAHGHERLFVDLRRQYEQKYNRFQVSADALTGSAPNLVAGRIASIFDLRGPNLVLDAACASSLAALACAINSLQTGECDIALAGGVETWVDIHAFVQFSKVKALSEHGCFPFDERADGFVLGEGCGMVVLRRLDDARRDGVTVHAVIRGIGSSSDGADSPGVTAPSFQGQVRALSRAYEVAGIDPADLDYIECHGTGTRLGDPIELASLHHLQSSSRANRKRPLPVASVKASVGHLRTAAGMAGLLNAMMVVNRRVIPPQVNFEKPTPAFDWSGSCLRVPTQPGMIEHEHPVAGVSSFGFGGINYHVVLSASPSGAGPARIRAAARVKPGPHRDTAFIFPGQGSQYVGMLGELLETDTGKRLAAEADDIVFRLTGRSLADVVQPAGFCGHATDAQSEALRSTEIAQPAILLVSAIMVELVREQGIEPGMMLGHSLGEYSALHAAGAISFAHAIEAVTRRGLLMHTLPDQMPSGMAYALADRETLEALMRTSQSGITIANINAYDQHVVAGPLAELNDFIDVVRKAGFQAGRLSVDRAFHSPMVSRAAAPLRLVLERISFKSPGCPVPANMTGRYYPWNETMTRAPLSDRDRGDMIDLLCRQIDQPVDFVGQIEAAYAAGVRRFVETGPRCVLRGLVEDILQGKPVQVVALDDQASSIASRIRALPLLLQTPLNITRRPLPNLKPPEPRDRAAGPSTISDAGSLRDRIRAIISDVTGYEPPVIGDDTQLDRDLGIDSLQMVKIASRLRGAILPSETAGFRHLTSINRIVAAIEASRITPAGKPAHFDCYRSIENGERAVEAESPEAGAGPLPDFMRRVGTAEQLCSEAIPALLKSIQQHATRSADRNHARFCVITFGRDPCTSTAWFRAFRGFIVSAARELPAITFAYHHVDSDTLSDDFTRMLCSQIGIGRRWSSPNRWTSPSLQLLTLPPDSSDGMRTILTAKDLVLVTGGARGIAAACVKSLLKKTDARFLLIGQRAEPEAWFSAEGRGRVDYLAADVADMDGLIRAGLGTRDITLIIHAAGLTPLTPLPRKTETEVRRVMNVKALGLVNILQATSSARLRGVISFSSIVAHFGNLAQQDYAAANGFLDGFIDDRGAPHLSIGWTAWSGTGMAARGLAKDVLETSGIDFLPVEEGVLWFEKILAWWFKQDRGPSTVVEVFAGLGKTLEAEPEKPADPSNRQTLPAHVVLINQDGADIPVFGICGIYGHAYRLQLVARKMPPSIPLYAMEPPGMNWTIAGCSRFEEMAEFYADTIEQCRKTGPLGLLGTSFGGNMAFEVAKLLQARGRSVPFLALVDTMPPDEDPQEHDRLDRVIARQIKKSWDPVSRAGARMARTQLDAFRNFKPRGTYQGGIYYFLMTGFGWPGRLDRRLAWQHLASGGMKICCLPGIHGEFAAKHACHELAGGLAAIVRHAPGTFLDLENYFRTYTPDPVAIHGEKPAGAKIPVISGEIKKCIRFRNRLWLKGRIRAKSDQPVFVGAVLDGNLIHAARAHRHVMLASHFSFEMVVDFHRIPDRDVTITMLAWTGDTCREFQTVQLADYFPIT